MKPTIEGFCVITAPDGFYDVTTIYDLFSLGKPKPFGCKFKTEEDAEDHKQECLHQAMMEYERCMRQGCSFPYND